MNKIVLHSYPFGKHMGGLHVAQTGLLCRRSSLPLAIPQRHNGCWEAIVLAEQSMLVHGGPPCLEQKHH